MPNDLRFDLPAGATAHILAEDQDSEQRQSRRRGALVSVQSAAGASSSTHVHLTASYEVPSAAEDRTIVVTPINFSGPSEHRIAQPTPPSFVVRRTTEDDSCTRLTCVSPHDQESAWDVLVRVMPARTQG